MTLEDTSSILSAANTAFVDEDYQEALSLYARAIETSPSTPDLYLKRAACYHQLEQFREAVEDAKAAAMLAGGDPKVVGKAHIRRGMGLLELGNAQEALDAFLEARRVTGDADGVKRWIEKCEKLGAVVPKPVSTSAPAPSSNVASTSTPASIPQPASFLPPSKIRHEWFQNENFVTLTVFVKNAKSEDVNLVLVERALSLSVKLPSGGDYSLELDPLAHEIVPSESKHSILSTKIEIKLKKKDLGVRWGTLEGEEIGPVTTVAGANAQDRPAYPSSAKKKHDWDAVAKSLEQEKPEGEQALNALFQQIYRDSSEEVRRAMMKSYIESNGTCLSTNWEEVGKKTVETTPPEGMIAKKYEV
ncbi:co-chaperone SGT1 [Spizellomyces punctatus DAOM BR117]|uniref:SGS domain-containing protein n=1 Tax=Spizellomyces punctatus (strain DAOM BR117) TaxID=645134 RepID=A0A0L0HNP8_SPIPD|nr:co-chaperone SGT1 [Spizellomyces punctatus DAOM BR117]KND03056.1 hypothetical protein SPPG_02120 [Spizellomyces punctatus DAOM BR117]|eukprot:XP_016611095.1 hypothetical protein SPPG_02120 [Spizellomyces punctatus DAOM BR117]